MNDITSKPSALQGSLRAMEVMKQRLQPTQAREAQTAGFGAALKHALESVSAQQLQAQTLSREFQLGNPDVGLEETMIAAQKASISFQAAVQVRNRLVSVYTEIMGMNV
jgi:flagellar hook-basal body complex protein FliE